MCLFALVEIECFYTFRSSISLKTVGADSAEPESVLARFSAAALFASVGVSKKLAGPKVYSKVMEVSPDRCDAYGRLFRFDVIEDMEVSCSGFEPSM